MENYYAHRMAYWILWTRTKYSRKIAGDIATRTGYKQSIKKKNSDCEIPFLCTKIMLIDSVRAIIPINLYISFWYRDYTESLRGYPKDSDHRIEQD